DHGGGKLERARIGSALEVRDPDGAIAGGAADRTVALRDDLPRCRAAQPAFRVRVIEVKAVAADRVENARKPIGGADLAQHGLRLILLPVDGAIRLAQRWPRPPANIGARVIQWLGLEPRFGDARKRQLERRDGGFGNLVAI